MLLLPFEISTGLNKLAFTFMSVGGEDSSIRNVVESFLMSAERILDQFRAVALAKSSECSDATRSTQQIFSECCTEGFLQLLQLLGSLRQDVYQIDTIPLNKPTDDANRNFDDPPLCPEHCIFDSVTSRRTVASCVPGTVSTSHMIDPTCDSAQGLLTLLPSLTASNLHVGGGGMSPTHDARQWSFLEVKPLNSDSSRNVDKKKAPVKQSGCVGALMEKVEEARALFYSATGGGELGRQLLGDDSVVLASGGISLGDSRISARLRALGDSNPTASWGVL